MPNQRWELVFIDPAGQKTMSVLDVDGSRAKELAVAWNARRDHFLTTAKPRPGTWVAQPKEKTAWALR